MIHKNIAKLNYSDYTHEELLYYHLNKKASEYFDITK